MTIWTDVVEEFESESLIGPHVYEQALDAARLVSSSYSPDRYTTGSWSRQNVEDLAHDMLARLLSGSRYRTMVERCALVEGDELGAFKRSLRHQVRTELHYRYRDRVRQTVVDQQLGKAMKVLASPEFNEGSRGGLAAFSLAGHAIESRAPTEGEIRHSALAARKVEWRTPEKGDSAPSVYGTEELRQVLTLALASTPTDLTIHDFREIFNFVLTGWANFAIGERVVATVEQQAEARALAHEAYDGLSDPERDLFRRYLSDESSVETGEAYGIGDSTIRMRRQRLFNKIRVILEVADELTREHAVSLLEGLVIEAANDD